MAPVTSRPAADQSGRDERSDRRCGCRKVPARPQSVEEAVVIGIDTNLLVRYFVQDDARQVRQVDDLIDFALRTGERLGISAIVLRELVWVLKTVSLLGHPPFAVL